VTDDDDERGHRENRTDTPHDARRRDASVDP
jgi:hypothetical protein